jgi:hypothetical protein
VVGTTAQWRAHSHWTVVLRAHHSGVSARSTPCQIEPIRAQQARAEPSQAESSRAKPSRAEASRPTDRPTARPSRSSVAVFIFLHATFGRGSREPEDRLRVLLARFFASLLRVSNTSCEPLVFIISIYVYMLYFPKLPIEYVGDSAASSVD